MARLGCRADNAIEPARRAEEQEGQEKEQEGEEEGDDEEEEEEEEEEGEGRRGASGARALLAIGHTTVVAGGRGISTTAQESIYLCVEVHSYQPHAPR